MEQFPKGLFFLFAVKWPFIFIFYCCSSTVVSIFLPPLSPTQPTPTSQPQSFPLLALSMGPLYMFPDDPSPSFPHYHPFPTPLVTVSLFFIVSGYTLLACLFCWLGSIYRWDHMVFFFHYWLISLSIILSSSIHAVEKGRSSFLSAV